MISVIMPARNADVYIQEAILSVLQQTGADFELLIADDASTDTTWRIISSYRHDPRVRIWRFKKKKGASGTRNYLIRRANGAYLAFCDADDKMLPEFLKIMTKILDRNSGIGVVYSNRLSIGRSGKLHLDRRSRGPVKTWDLIDGPISNGGTVVRKHLFEKVGGYRKELLFFEDYDLFWRLAEVTRFRYYQGKPLYFYRKRPGSLSDRPKRNLSAVQTNILRGVIARRYGFKPNW